MGELYVEGVATHDGPEPCAVGRKAAGEALDRGTCRPGYGAAKSPSPGCRRRRKGWKATSRAALHASRQRTPRGQRTLGMHGISMRENREIPPSPGREIAGRAAQGRPRPQA
jgi:hypothetical protein